LDTGLFLDHRITRSLVRDAAQGANFLNLFAYTGTFSVYAAAGGAAQTTSVDLSSTYLTWAAENLRLNGFEGKKHRQIQSDVMRYLGDLPPGRPFNLVVVDPPTYSNSKNLAADWDIQRDYVALLKRVLIHTAAGGVIFFSTNSRRFKLDEGNLRGVTIHNITRQTIPEDFRNLRIHQCWRIIKTGT
jgi:23S rRNA (cytosine1962-C5)-methyltransferase